MHKCINRSLGNIYHLEQLVSNFFPYSQNQLEFDQDVTIIFQGDEENASKMLGKTAYYDPEAFEITLYTDNRHPKDIMRSLSHELVHHAQNCRGDFGRCDAPGWELGSANGNAVCSKDTGVGYAQRDPHLRKMEREAYTRGNLIFRDFEDLIKTGKINVEIDFSNSGEPKMSLKELRSVNFNKNIMKKWGFLKEAKEEAIEVKEDETLAEDSAEEESEHYGEDESDDKREEDSLEGHLNAIEHHLKALRDDMRVDQHREDDHLEEAGGRYRKDDSEKRPWDSEPGERAEEKAVTSVKGKKTVPEGVERKISAKDAKALVGRILERIRKEGK
jgi:hypothetical protein